jgi:DUF1365 family protein
MNSALYSGWIQHRRFGPAKNARALMQFPLITARVSALIYWQALKLFVKRAPFHARPRAT